MRVRLMYAASHAYSSFFPARFKSSPPAPPISPACWMALSPRTMSLASERPPPATSASALGASQVVEFLDSLKNYEKLGVPRGAGTDSAEGFDLDRMHRLLLALGNPLSYYPVIHVAGTKGKGSTAAFISSILRAQGYSVGSYTSPHIMSIHERIMAGKNENAITPVAFQELFEDNRSILEAQVAAELGFLTYFEVLTALAFKYFASVNVDIAVVEAGLGGARDATNVISAGGLAVAVITNIGKEHLAALGGSLESIAFAKSGIIKQGRPVVLGGPLDLRSEAILCEVAATKEAGVIRAFGEGMHYNIGDIKLEDGGAVQCCDLSVDSTLHGGLSSWKLFKKSLPLKMMGSHQLDNVLTAICTILCLCNQGWKVEENAIWAGLERTFIPGRFQVMSKAEAMEVGCGESSLVLDGAHTASSAKALASTLSMVFPSHTLAFVMAMASDKDHLAFCEQLMSGVTPNVVVVAEALIAGSKSRSTPASILADCWMQAGKTNNQEVVHAFTEDDLKSFKAKSAMMIAESESVVSAIRKASHLLQGAKQKAVICVTGSLHAVSEVLSHLKPDLLRNP